MNRLREYAIGNILRSTDDAFERARAILLYRLSIMFTLIFLVPLVSDFLLGYYKALIVHCFAFVTLIFMPVVLRMQNNIEKSVNLLFILCNTISFLVFAILNPTVIDAIGISWTIFFLILSALMQRGWVRILFCCFLLWIPTIYILINRALDGALTWEAVQQRGAENPPIFLMFIPILLSIYAVWTNTTTIQEAKKTIIDQKAMIDEKNKDLLDSIHYAQRIQNSLLPTEKYIQRNLKRLKKEE